ncbi:MAG: hypothetical protein SGI77_10555 [Pirellulaceae bacterium]|nr:hypothetical protein [Pirellulaceae bacterium]
MSFVLERDLIATLGLLTRAYLEFDPPVVSNGVTTHYGGFNVQALVIDNRDGEVLAVGANQIFRDENPLQHAEQIALRIALERLKQKKPRPSGMTVDTYYKTMLFMEPGSDDESIYRKRCTLYNVFDPCGFCAVTLLIAYMKRIAYVFEDNTFSAVYKDMGTNYFNGRESRKEAVQVSDDASSSNWISKASLLIQKLRQKVHHLEESGTKLVMTLDQCRDDLEVIAHLFWQIDESSLVTSNEEKSRNARTLSELRRICGGV